MKQVIHIYGASGSGTSTLGKKISQELGYRFLDSDDYFWLPTDPRFIKVRNIDERIRLLREDIDSSDNVVIAGSLVGWGDFLIPEFTLVIRLVTDTDVRVARLRKREFERFGARIEPDGDMYEQHLDFIKWASDYDTGDVEMRSKANHNEWQKLLKCKQIVLNGADSVDFNFEEILKEISLSTQSSGGPAL